MEYRKSHKVIREKKVVTKNKVVIFKKSSYREELRRMGCLLV